MGAAGSHSVQQDGSEEQRDLYDVLDIDPEATVEDIRRAFRKLALKEHPDKVPPEDREAATRRFVSIQQAYEVLSDPQERAWYDSHRDELLNGDTGDTTDLRSTSAGQARKSPAAAKVNTKSLLRFFSTTTWSKFDDSDKGFYAVYRNLFDLIAADEENATPYPGEPEFSDNVPFYPSFGYQSSSYLDKNDRDQPPIKTFYSIWSNFASRKSFASFDRYRMSEAPDRRYKRAMEKENKRSREEARREYNDTVRTLVAFVKKRDPRLQTQTPEERQRAKLAQAEKLKAESLQNALDRARRREEAAQQYREQEWQKNSSNTVLENELIGQSDDGSEEEEWYCAACEKIFTTLGGWENHERSKKHVKTVERLRRELEKDEMLFAGDVPEENDSAAEPLSDNEESDVESELHARVERLDMTDEQNSSAEKDIENGDAEERPELEMDTSEPPSKQNEYKSDQKPPKVKQRRGKRRNQMLDSEGDVTPQQDNTLDSGSGSTTPLTKKEKRRAKDAAKKEDIQTGTLAKQCNVCREEFPSRSKLFEHIKATGHALASEQQRSKGGKKTGRRR